MPAELEGSSVTFTDEAEAALRRVLSRVERRIRARALDDAVRTRGVPAEVTGSDIQRAYFRVTRTGPLVGREDEAVFRGPQSVRLFPRELAEIKRLKEGRVARKSVALRVAYLYMWLGAVTTAVGIFWAPIYHQVRILVQDSAWHVGLVIVATGVSVFAVGAGARALFLERIRADAARRPGLDS